MKANENEILTIAGERVEKRYESDFYDACGKCCFHNIFVTCNVRTLCHGCPCDKYSDHENRRFAYFVRTEEDENKTQKALPEVIYCGRNCYGNLSYSNTKVLPNMRPYVPAEETEADLEAEISRFEDELHGFEGSSRADCINIARHFAEWERKRTLDKVVEWMKANLTYTHPRKGVETCMVNIPAFLDTMNEENT